MSASAAGNAAGPAAFRDLAPRRTAPSGARRGRLRIALADPGRHDSGAALGRRHARPGADRHRQDGGIRAARARPRIDLAGREPQVLVLVPTRELALQVAEAFQRYAAHLKGFHVLPIYGGQSYQPQFNALRRGVHVVVGTPGRVIDHMDRGTLKLTGLTLLVLDEADEMLQHGFSRCGREHSREDPAERQVALFSATLAAPIRRIAQKHLRSPVEVTIKSKTAPRPTSASATGS